MPDPVETLSAVAQAALRPVAQQVEQQMAAKVAELLPRVQSGQLSPGDALLNLQRASEQIASRVQWAPQGAVGSQATQRQAQQVARRAARRVLDQAGARLREARTQAQQTGTQRTAALLDPVGRLLGGEGDGRGGAEKVMMALPFVLLGAVGGFAVAHATGKSTGTGIALGSLAGALASLLLGRTPAPAAAAAPPAAPAGVQVREA